MKPPNKLPPEDVPPPRFLAAARVLAGLSQVDLARLAGVAVSSLARYERGDRTIRSDTLAALLTVLRARGIQFGLEGDGTVGVLRVVDVGPAKVG